MSSPVRSDLLDLDRDLPTTPEDVAALRRCRATPPLDTAGYLRFLAALPGASGVELRKRRGPSGEPFDLLA